MALRCFVVTSCYRTCWRCGGFVHRQSSLLCSRWSTSLSSPRLHVLSRHLIQPRGLVSSDSSPREHLQSVLTGKTARDSSYRDKESEGEGGEYSERLIICVLVVGLMLCAGTNQSV